MKRIKEIERLLSIYYNKIKWTAKDKDNVQRLELELYILEKKYI